MCVLFVDVVLLGCGDGEHNGQSDLMRDDAQKAGNFNLGSTFTNLIRKFSKVTGNGLAELTTNQLRRMR